MNAPVNNQNDIQSSTPLRQAKDSILLSKTPWYKEAAGLVAVITWLAIVGLNMWAIIADVSLQRPYYLAILYVIACVASLLRSANPKVDLEKPEI